jgi:hypothetical protein
MSLCKAVVKAWIEGQMFAEGGIGAKQIVDAVKKVVQGRLYV